jgi:hemerythrin superfamily protein
MPSILDLLKEDHQQVSTKFGEYLQSTASEADRQKQAIEIIKALTVHAVIEEEIFYPEARKAIQTRTPELIDKALREHAHAKRLIAQVEAGLTDKVARDAAMRVLMSAVFMHVREEETKIFPEVRLSIAALDSIGTMAEMRKNELMAIG